MSAPSIDHNICIYRGLEIRVPWNQLVTQHLTIILVNRACGCRVEKGVICMSFCTADTTGHFTHIGKGWENTKTSKGSETQRPQYNDLLGISNQQVELGSV